MTRILADASAAFDQRAGVGRYSRNVLDRLIPVLAEADWTLFRAPAGEVRWTPPRNTRTVTWPLSRRRFDQLAVRLGLPLPFRPLTGKQDLVYSPDFTAPPLRGVPRLVTIHDVAFLTHSHLTTPGTAAFLRRAVEREVRRGAWLAVVSETTRARVMEHLGVARARTVLALDGVDSRFFGVNPLTTEERRTLGVPDEFLLMVGTLEPRKNHEGVLRVIEGRRDPGMPLVIVGRRGWGTDHLLPQLERLQARGRVIWLDNLPDAYLPSVYASCKGVLYPSWTEGFGLPVLEALAAGRPVVTGNDPVFAEVAGPCAVPVNPADDDAMLAAIRMLEESDDSDAAVTARRERAAMFDWNQPVQALASWIRQVAGNGNEQ